MLDIEKARKVAISAWRKDREWGTVRTVDDNETVEYEHGWYFCPMFIVPPAPMMVVGNGHVFVDRSRGKCWGLSDMLFELAYEIESLRLHGKPSGSVPHPVGLFPSSDTVQNIEDGTRQLRDCLMQHVDFRTAAIDCKLSALRKGYGVVVSCKSDSDVSDLVREFEEGKCVTAYRVEWPGREPYLIGVVRRAKYFFSHYF